MTLEELGVPYQVRPIALGKNEQKEDWFLKINPNGCAARCAHPERFTLCSECNVTWQAQPCHASAAKLINCQGILQAHPRNDGWRRARV